ncbi:hypothetical protein BJX68DRAFT_270386 [Aspergillus pseudodeflectus]|uniref:FAD/NAD(P)-binding domain-containing protein n=1 Tax=Aspergillus pseudodeflectus TaxID=176178 RepID=A0ABR4JSP8_9EURO
MNLTIPLLTMSLATNLTTTLFDALIIGAGPGGLSVATGLARQLHTAVVFDSGVYRNARATHMHNVLGWDHVNPAELRAKGKADLLARYATVQFQNETVESVRRMKTESSLFEAVDGKGNKWYGRKVVLATGVKDVMLDIEGFEECWGRNIFHCLFCDGYEERGQKSVGFLAMGPIVKMGRGAHLARMALRLSESVTAYTNGNEAVATELKDQLAGLNVVIDNRPIARFEKMSEGAKVRVHFDDNESKEEGFLVYAPETKINAPFATQLSLKMTQGGDIEVNQPFFETSMPGVFAVGDIAGPIKAVTPAIYSGTMVAGGLVGQLQAEQAPELVGEASL